MIKICFICNWGLNSSQLLNKYRLQTPGNTGRWGSIIGVDDIYAADWIVCLEDLPADFYKNYPLADPKKILFFAREPEWLVQRKWAEHDSIYKFDYTTFRHLSVWMVEKSYDELNQFVYEKRSKKVACITSNKKLSAAQKERLEFIGNFCNKHNNRLDVYGLGMDKESLGENFKGTVNYSQVVTDGVKESKFYTLKDYNYSLCIENGSYNNYFTEKICDSYLSLTMPCYYGCRNIHEYFPQQSYHYIDIKDKSSLDYLKEITELPLSKQNIDALLEARDLVLNRYNIWPSLLDIIMKL